jgi:hypothetical protein
MQKKPRMDLDHFMVALYQCSPVFIHGRLNLNGSCLRGVLAWRTGRHTQKIFWSVEKYCFGDLERFLQ